MKHRSLSIISFAAILFLFTGCISVKDQPDKPSQEKEVSEKSDKVEKALIDTGGLKNFLSNPGFENGKGKWGQFGYCTVEVTSDKAHSGSNSLFVTERTSAWEGAGIEMKSIFKQGSTYVVSAWVMLENVPSSAIKITVKRITDMGENYDQVLAAKANNSSWVEIQGEYIVDPTGTIESCIMYVEGLPPGTNFYLDDVKVVQIGPAKVYEGDEGNETASSDGKKQPEDNISEGLIENSGFENNIDGWNAFGSCSIKQSKKQAHSGKNSVYVSDRTGDWNGVATNVTDIIEQGKTYKVTGWVFLENTPSSAIHISLIQNDSTGENFIRVQTLEVTKGTWAKISGEFAIESDSITDMILYFEGPDPGVNYYIDDVILQGL